MSPSLQAGNPTIIAAFERALLHQALVVLVLIGILGVAWNLLRASQLRQALSTHDLLASATASSGSSRLSPRQPSPRRPGTTEATARRVLRIGFGLLWIFDGVLQTQTSMPLGMPQQVVEPSLAGTPAWLHSLVGAGVTIWSDHPITAATSVVWIQAGLGFLLLVAPRGSWSRLAGLATVGWGLVVWVFGESLGGILAPGLSWLFGAPGAALLYCVAGALLALPERSWSGQRLGMWTLRAAGVYLAGMAILQAWPGRGFWHGVAGPHRAPGVLAAMLISMARTPQPAFLSSLLTAFAHLTEADGFAVNLVVVVALGSTGALLVCGRGRALRLGIAAGVLISIVSWVLVQDLGFLGGTGTDPNTMVPTILLLCGAFLAASRPAEVVAGAKVLNPSPELAAVPELAESVAAPELAERTAVPELAAVPAPTKRPGSRSRPLRERVSLDPAYALRTLAALVAVAVVALGAAPMAVASTNPQASPILADAIDGAPSAMHEVAPRFILTDQRGDALSLQSLRGRAVVLTFLDPVCVSDCPIIAQELVEADRLLGTERPRVELVAVVANPLYRSTAYTLAFDHQEGLGRLPNWLYLTGSLSGLDKVWTDYGVQVGYSPGGAMIAHTDIAYVIGPHGYLRYVLNAAPGPGSAATRSSFAVTLAMTIRTVLATSGTGR